MKLVFLICSLFLTNAYANYELKHNDFYQIHVDSYLGEAQKLFDRLRVPIIEGGVSSIKYFKIEYPQYLDYEHPVFSVKCTVTDEDHRGLSNCVIKIFRSSSSNFSRDQNRAHVYLNYDAQAREAASKFYHSLGEEIVFESLDKKLSIRKRFDENGTAYGLYIKYKQK